MNAKQSKNIISWKEVSDINKPNLITFYTEDGGIVGSFYLRSWTTHDERCDIAKEHGLKEWSHYSMHNTIWGCKRDNCMNWYNLNPDHTIIENSKF